MLNDAVTSALIGMVENPHSGAPCHFDSADLQGLRRMTITRFPKHLIFYQIEDAEITILRVLHGARHLENLP
jgi:toxin ParE1/3/4